MLVNVSQKSRWRPHIYCFVQQPKDTHFTVSKEERNQNIYTLKKLESENLYLFFFLNSTQWLYYENIR